jgi:hypothetical protein
MRGKHSVWVAAGFLMLAGPVAAQKSEKLPTKAVHASASAQSGASLRERVTNYYHDIEQNNKAEAFELVAPESRNDFFNMDYNSLVAFRISAIHYSQDRSTATVDVVRSEKVPPFLQILDLPVKDTWKRIGGQWRIVLPSTHDVATPFGVMHFGGQSDHAASASEPPPIMPNKIDPAQYLDVLKSAMAQSDKSAAPKGAQTPLERPTGAKKPDDSRKENANPPSAHQ